MQLSESLLLHWRHWMRSMNDTAREAPSHFVCEASSGSSGGGGEDEQGGGGGGGKRKRKGEEGGRRYEATAKRARGATGTTGDHGEGGARRCGEG